MRHYDPAVAPSSDVWLGLDEAERILLVERYHRRVGVALPDARLHAVIHTIVESQIAAAVPQVVAAVERLRHEGLDRHESIHAVGSVLIGHIHDAMQAPELAGAVSDAYYAGLETLSAASWGAT